MNFVAGFLLKIDLLSLTLGSLLGALTSAWYILWLSQPKLVEVGSMSGLTTQMILQNRMGFLGITSTDTVIFGRRFFSGRAIGFPFERATARGCTATVKDLQTGEYICSLMWQEGELFKREVDIASGGQANLVLFSKQGALPDHYYFVQPIADSIVSQTPSPNATQFNGSRDFLIHIQFSNGMKRQGFKVSIIRSLNGTLRYRTEKAGGGI